MQHILLSGFNLYPQWFSIVPIYSFNIYFINPGWILMRLGEL